MAKKEKTKFITPDIMKSSIIGAFQKLDPRYMIKNPVMFVVELGFFITLVLTIFPTYSVKEEKIEFIMVL